MSVKLPGEDSDLVLPGASEAAERSGGRALRVLVVEDSPVQAQQAVKVLEASGFRTEVANRLDAALVRIASSPPDLVLLDLYLPDAADLDGLARIVLAAPGTPVVVLTSRDDDKLAREAIRSGAQDYLVKERWEGQLLARTVRYAVERQRVKARLQVMAAELGAKNAELERLNAEMNQMVGMVAHDLRNPLAIILTYADFLGDGCVQGEAGESQRRFLDAITNSSRFMLQVVGDLLDLSAIESGKLNLDLASTDPAVLVAASVERNALLARRKGIEVGFEAEAGIPRVTIDPRKIEQVLDNLIGNAVKYSLPGSRVSVRVALSGVCPGGIRVSVRDHGPGIPPAELDKLFKAFGTTTVRATAGEKSTGLGLAICRRIVEGHGGEISVESEVGKGTTFTFGVPAQPPSRWVGAV